MKSSQYIEKKLDIRTHRCSLVEFEKYRAKEGLHYPGIGSNFVANNLIQLTYNPTYFAHKVEDCNRKLRYFVEYPNCGNIWIKEVTCEDWLALLSSQKKLKDLEDL